MSEKINAETETRDESTGDKPDAVNENAGVVNENSGVVNENSDAGNAERDWVKEAYECFVKNAVESDPTDPVKAVAAYFEKNATDKLKATAEAEGKTAEGCWKFIEAVARKALGGRSGHIDPVTVYAIAMHYFQDVPKDWNEMKPDAGKEAKSKKLDAEAAARARKIAHERRVKLAKELGDKEFSAKVAEEGRKLAKTDAKKTGAKRKKHGEEQGFFFDLLETQPVGPTGEGAEDEVR